ncbi:MAG: SDR family NAD(P)-dependent oxidoreductase, partial [Actinomycetota bacterium]
MAGSNFSQASPSEPPRPVALITGASRGLGLALARALARLGWALVIDARGGPGLEAAAAELGSSTEIRALQGDVSDGTHRAELVRAAEELGRLDLLVNNASVLGPS